MHVACGSLDEGVEARTGEFAPLFRPTRIAFVGLLPVRASGRSSRCVHMLAARFDIHRTGLGGLSAAGAGDDDRVSLAPQEADQGAGAVRPPSLAASDDDERF